MDQPPMSNMPPAAPEHPAPREGWRPMSGLAVTTFVLSLVLVVIALLGFWWIEIVPIVLGVLTLIYVRADKRRGRLLAIWGLVIAAGAGACSFAGHEALKGTFERVAKPILDALSADVSDVEKDAALRPWTYAPALDEDPDLLAKFRARYEAVVAAYGPYQGEVDLGGPFVGSMGFMMPPSDVFEVGGEGKRPAFIMMAAVYVPVLFERGRVIMAIVFEKANDKGVQSLQRLEDSDRSPIVSDLRFYAEKPPPSGP